MALVIWLLGLVLQPIIYLVVWATVTHSAGGAVGGYRSSDFAGYFVVLMVVNHLTFTWVIYGFDQRVRQGTLSPLLLRPIHPIHLDVAENIGYKLITFPVVLVAAVTLAFIFHAHIAPDPWKIAAFPPALLFSFAIRFMFEWSLALAAFWTTRSSALNQMYDVALLFLSGQVAPLSLFPAPVQALNEFLPFRWMVSFPVQVLRGGMRPGAVIEGLSIQLVWTAVAFLTLQIVWRFGVQRYSAVGS